MDSRELEIETGRLRLRLFRPQDMEAACHIWRDPLVTKYINDGEPLPREQVRKFLTRSREFWTAHGFGQFALLHKSDQKLIGYCGFKFLEETGEVELLYGMLPGYWNQGLMTEAARACLRYAFEQTPLERIVAIAEPTNTGSWRIMEKVGMRHEGELLHQHRTMLYYAISREQFRADASPYILSRANQALDG
jgi:ribosomal-protein-alanine N-acetyltransferase